MAISDSGIFMKGLITGGVLFLTDTLLRMIPGFSPILFFFVEGLVVAYLDQNYFYVPDPNSA